MSFTCEKHGRALPCSYCRIEEYAPPTEPAEELERISKMVTDNAIQYAKELADAFEERDRLRAENEKLRAVMKGHIEAVTSGDDAKVTLSYGLLKQALADAGNKR